MHDAARARGVKVALRRCVLPLQSPVDMFALLYSRGEIICISVIRLEKQCHRSE